MLDVQASIVTPDGVRDGDPAALSGLTMRRGAAVLAYAEHVAAPGRAVEAAADAFARFRRAVVEAGDPRHVDPERTLLRTTRYASGVRAPRDVALRARLRGGDGPSPCELVPELLAARAERDLGDADLGRLARHLARCAPCRAAEARFRAGERAYRDAPSEVPTPFAARAIMAALLDVAPDATPARRLAAVPDPGEPAAPVDPEPAVEEPAPLLDVAPGPVATAVAQPTYEFAALPAEAFDAADTPLAEPEALDPAPTAIAEAEALDAAGPPLTATEPLDALGVPDDDDAGGEWARDDALFAPLTPLADEPRRRRSPLAILAVVLVVLVVLAALAVTVVAVVDVAGS